MQKKIRCVLSSLVMKVEVFQRLARNVTGGTENLMLFKFGQHLTTLLKHPKITMLLHNISEDGSKELKDNC